MSSRISKSSTNNWTPPCGGDGKRCRNRKRFRSLEEIVQHYIDCKRPRARNELRFYAEQQDLASAIRVGALAINPKEKRHDHQRRIPGNYLEHFRQRIWRKRKAVRKCNRFVELMGICESAAAEIWKKPGLAVYDTAHRIGAHLGINPDRVYLHTGTRVGARNLGFEGNRDYILPRELPNAFRRLKPYEMEDCLCIYKDSLKSLAGTS